MSKHEINVKKRSVLADLDFDPVTAKRASWEAFEFSIPTENQIRVMNASYGATKAEHTYTVTVDVRDDGIVPLHCTCPADQHQSGACKHRIACAVRRVVLSAAVAYRADPSIDPGEPVVLADGGEVNATDYETVKNECVNDVDWCLGPQETSDDPLPCFECFCKE
jgi:hypothetical protein